MVQAMTKVIGSMNIPFTIKVMVHSQSQELQTRFAQVCEQIHIDLEQVNTTFSPFNDDSLLSQFNRGDYELLNQSADFREVFTLSNVAKADTEEYFDPYFDGTYNPTGLVKGWAIERILNQRLMPWLDLSEVVGVSINGGGDIQTAVSPDSGFSWHLGVEDPDHNGYLIGQYDLMNGGLATSGVNKRGEHIKRTTSSLKQVTIIDPSLMNADVWATAGMAAGTDAFLKLVQSYQLSGVIVDAKQGHIHFESGEIKDVKTS